MARTAPRPRRSSTRKPPGRARSWPRRLFGLLLVAAAAALAWAPMDPAWVDRVYARGWYLAAQPLLTSLSSLVPVALLDVWIVAAAAVCIWSIWRIRRAPAGTRLPAAIRTVSNGFVVAAGVYLVFLACWGLNYRRLPITSALDFDQARVTAFEVDAASLRTVAHLNRLHEAAHRDLQTMTTMAAVRVRLAPAFATAQRHLGAGRLATAGRPKTSMLTPFFRWASVDGLVNPLGLEVIVNPEVLPVERPFVIAHEWGHLAGWARESEASYAGWLTCLESEQAGQYSAWLSLYWHLRRELPRDRLRAIDDTLAAGPRHDLAAIAARLQRSQPLIQEASWRTYDQFLKAHRVDAGVKSYDQVVTLILGTATDAAGRPRPR